MRTREFSKLIQKLKRGELSPQEQEMLDNFLESFQKNQSEWAENEMGEKRVVEERILSRILRDISEKKIHHVNTVFLSPSLLKRAAAIALFFILSSGILYEAGIFSKRIAPAVWSEAVTLPGEKSIILLSDSSQVTLNADSKLRYPDRFNGTDREVYLDGEGYFAIRHLNSQPFVVHTGKLSTTVLGTKFDISAYPDSRTIAVSLLEGKVRVTRNEAGKADKTVVLEPEEQVIYNKESGISSFGRFDSLETVGWKDNVYKYESEPLREVLPELERAFGTKLVITDEAVLGQKITITFEDNSEKTVIDVIKNLTGLEYSIVKGEDNKQEVHFVRRAQ
jgi:ferric-dicitrate binding protein FerR (iron transport regulator)